jgi:hypothetical protein
VDDQDQDQIVSVKFCYSSEAPRQSIPVQRGVG